MSQHPGRLRYPISVDWLEGLGMDQHTLREHEIISSEVTTTLIKRNTDCRDGMGNVGETALIIRTCS